VLSGIVIGTDSIPIPDVAIINTRTGIAVRTNSEGFFRTEIAAKDSLCAFHIAYKRFFINEKDNGKYIVIEPDIQELMQVNVTNKNKQEQKNLDKTLNDIKRLAPMKTIPQYDMESRQSKFIEENGSHNKGFSPFFGPTFRIPFEKLTAVAGTSEKRQKKKLTSHYHLVKKKK
jgi:hypothetical protein